MLTARVLNNSSAGEIFPGGAYAQSTTAGYQAKQPLPPPALSAFSRVCSSKGLSRSVIRVSVDGGAAAFVWCRAHNSLIYPELSWGWGVSFKRSECYSQVLFPTYFLLLNLCEGQKQVLSGMWSLQQSKKFVETAKEYLPHSFLERSSQELFAKGLGKPCELGMWEGGAEAQLKGGVSDQVTVLPFCFVLFLPTLQGWGEGQFWGD